MEDPFGGRVTATSPTAGPMNKMPEANSTARSAPLGETLAVTVGAPSTRRLVVAAASSRSRIGSVTGLVKPRRVRSHCGRAPTKPPMNGA